MIMPISEFSIVLLTLLVVSRGVTGLSIPFKRDVRRNRCDRPI